VEEKPPQQKPIGTVFREKHKQNVETVKCENVLCADRKPARREHFRDTKNRQIERVHARFATLKKCFGI
jgi:hypothetical protein